MCQRCQGAAQLGNSLVATSPMHVCVMRFVRNDFAISSFKGFYGLIMFDAMPGGRGSIGAVLVRFMMQILIGDAP